MRDQICNNNIKIELNIFFIEIEYRNMISYRYKMDNMHVALLDFW